MTGLPNLGESWTRLAQHLMTKHGAPRDWLRKLDNTEASQEWQSYRELDNWHKRAHTSQPWMP